LKDPDRAHLFLVGFMGSGKSTVSALVAKQVGRPCVDLDREIEHRSGRTIAGIFADAGESDFRRIESRALSGLESDPPSVVAVGGGALDAWSNRRSIRRMGVSIWLDVDLEEARRRVVDRGARPLWKTEDSVAFRAFFERRRAIYALADGRVRVATQSPDAVVTAVVSLFKGFLIDSDNEMGILGASSGRIPGKNTPGGRTDLGRHNR
jgi:shikimate kinase